MQSLSEIFVMFSVSEQKWLMRHANLTPAKKHTHYNLHEIQELLQVTQEHQLWPEDGPFTMYRPTQNCAIRYNLKGITII